MKLLLAGLALLSQTLAATTSELSRSKEDKCDINSTFLVNMRIIPAGRGLIFEPSVHLYTMVWLHGLGDSAYGFESLFEYSPPLPNCKFVLPTAPSKPVTMNRGFYYNSWYDFKTIEDEYDPSAETSVEIVQAILDEEAKHTQHLILGGLSQGAVMSLYTGLAKYDKPLAAIVALSGYAFPMHIPEERKRIPVLMYHGARDELLTLERSQSSIEKNLRGINLTMEVDPELPHNIDDKEWEFMSQWLRRQLNIAN